LIGDNRPDREINVLFEILSTIPVTVSAAIVVATLSFSLARSTPHRVRSAGILTAWFAGVLVLGAPGVLDYRYGLGIPVLVPSRMKRTTRSFMSSAKRSSTRESTSARVYSGPSYSPWKSSLSDVAKAPAAEEHIFEQLGQSGRRSALRDRV